MITWLLSPLAWLLLAGALALCSLLLHRRSRQWLLAACGVMAAIALAAMTPIVANALVVPLERPVVTPGWCSDTPPSTALVLAGGLDGAPRHRHDFSVLNLSSRRRLDEAVAWWRERDGRDLVLVGGAGHADEPARAELMAGYTRMLGVPSTDLRLETDSVDSWSNARRSSELVPPVPEHIVLVTSSMHMPRAHLAFASAGFQICPMAVDSRKLPSRWPWALVPRTIGMHTTGAALHEWLGLAYYQWLARRSAREGGAGPAGSPDVARPGGVR